MDDYVGIGSFEDLGCVDGVCKFVFDELNAIVKGMHHRRIKVADWSDYSVTRLGDESADDVVTERSTASGYQNPSCRGGRFGSH